MNVAITLDGATLNRVFSYHSSGNGQKLRLQPELAALFTEQRRKRSSDDPAVKTLARSLLLRSDRGVSAIAVERHPLKQEHLQVRAATKAALSIARWLQLDGNSPSDDTFGEPEGDVIILGGPVSSEFTRLILGVGGPSPLFKVQLPITFDLEGSARNKGVIAGVRRLDPSWDVIVYGASQDPVKDYLLLSCFPNPYGIKKERIIVVAGRHAEGTQAIDWVLRDRDLLSRLISQSEKFLGWQALFELEFEGLRSVGVKLTNGPYAIDGPFEKLREIYSGKPFLSGIEPIPHFDPSGWYPTAANDRKPRAAISLLERSERRALAAPKQGANEMVEPDNPKLRLGPKRADETDQEYERRQDWTVNKMRETVDSAPQSEEAMYAWLEEFAKQTYGGGKD